MAALQTRQPFAALGSSRLQTLGSQKNRQNAISPAAAAAAACFSPPAKPTFNPSVKRRAAEPEPFDAFDAENIDPKALATPSKRTKGMNGGSIGKTSSKFYLSVDGGDKAAAPACAPKTTTTPVNNSSTDAAAAKRKAMLSLSVPTTSNITPIAHSRGSPKHKRVGLLAKQRRFSSSPFRRVDPPSFGLPKSAGLPFSIDAALSGTLTTYEPKDAQVESKHMPSGWFFDIHVDAPEEEAANLMEHSASVLDISSDDDCETRRRRNLEERGKENIPPPDFVAPARAPRLNHAAGAGAGSAEPSVHRGISNKLKAALKAKAVDAMLEDRAALADLEAADFYPEGLDEKSVEVVGIEKGKEKENDAAPVAAPIAAVAPLLAPNLPAPATATAEIVVFEDPLETL